MITHSSGMFNFDFLLQEDLAKGLFPFFVSSSLDNFICTREKEIVVLCHGFESDKVLFNPGMIFYL